jgi:regulatory protein
VAVALDRLAAQQLQDDARFVEVFVRSRVARGQGPLRIAQELRQRGIPDRAARAALDDGAHDWTALAHAALRRQFKSLPADPKGRARQLRFLEYRGFTAGQIRAATKGGEDFE